LQIFAELDVGFLKMEACPFGKQETTVRNVHLVSTPLIIRSLRLTFDVYMTCEKHALDCSHCLERSWQDG